MTDSVCGTGVAHRVSTVSVGEVLENERSLSRSGPLLSVLNGGLGREDVHTVDLQTRDVLATLIVFCEGCSAVGGGTHAVLVVCKITVRTLLTIK